jgi:hypothetical protein
MVKKERIIRRTAEQLAAKRGRSRTNWAKAAEMTKEQLEASIAAATDEAGHA